MSRALLVGALGAVLGALACEGDPDDPYFILGRVQGLTGHPVAGAPVSLFRDGSIMRFPQEPCFARIYREQARLSARSSVPDWELFREPTVTDVEGKFLFQLLRYEIEGDGAPHCYSAHVERGPTGARTSVWADMMTTGDVYLDRVYLWDHGEISIALTSQGHTLSAPSEPLPASDPVSAGFLAQEDLVAYEWEVTAQAQPLWRAEKTGEQFVVDAFLLEDFRDVEAHVNLLTFIAPPELQVLETPVGYFELASGPSVTIPTSTQRVPVSRGAPCSSRLKRFDPCPATDGTLDLVPFDLSVQRDNSIEISSSIVVLELRAPARPSLVIFRDLQTRGFPHVLIQGSADGVTWSPLGSLPARFITSDDKISAYELLTDSSRTTEGSHSTYFRMELTPLPEPITQIRLWIESSFGVREISFFE